MTTASLRECPGYGRFWAASTTSGFGTYVTTLALQVLVVVTLHGSAADVGVVNAARWLPYLLLGLVVGVLVDRRRRRPVLVGTDIGRGILLGAVPVLAATGTLRLPVLAGFMVVFGAMSLVHDAAFQSFLPRLVPPALLAHGNARLDQSDAVAQTSGPALGGGLVAALGAPLAVLVDALSYVISGVLLATIAVEEPVPADAGERDLGRELREGLSWVYRHRMLRALALGTHGWFACFGIVGAVFAPYALRTLHLGAFGLGVVLACAGVGGLAGSLAAPGLGQRFGAGRTVVTAHLLMPVSVALMAAAPGGGHLSGWLAVGTGQLMLGLGMGAMNANEMGYRQAVTPDRLQGRSNATMRSINRAMLVVAGPLGGLLGDAAGYRAALWTAAGGFLLVAVGLTVSPVRSARSPPAGAHSPRSRN